MAGDDGFREIHLNGKQLVFLFIVITVVAGVIFLCGVMVGRGVRNSTAASAAVEPAPASGVTGDVLPPSDAQAKPAPPPALPPTPPPIPAEEAAPQPAAADSARAGEPAKKAEPAKKGAPAAPPAQAPAAPAAAPPKSAATPAVNASEPAGDGFVVQVTALGDRVAAEAIVKRLVAKGYSAYLLGPPPGGTALYRVRVGKFKERREADTVRRRLEKEEQFKNCLITR